MNETVECESWETADSISGPYFLNFADFKKYFAILGVRRRKSA